MHTVLADRAGAAPDDIAILAPGRRPLTYGRLHGHIRETVAALNRTGVGRSDRVAVVLPNGPEMAVAFLALSAGAAGIMRKTCAGRVRRRGGAQDLALQE
ncbi:MAG: AMP-binding protein [Candidatus Brocadiia bacterium]|jgi:acyl-CoA synthetase (AMP-forming)/AMP-acid ligase II|nr:AMP-binding protein [Candidatus Brocadiia bacterium]